MLALEISKMIKAYSLSLVPRVARQGIIGVALGVPLNTRFNTSPSDGAAPAESDVARRPEPLPVRARVGERRDCAETAPSPRRTSSASRGLRDRARLDLRSGTFRDGRPCASLALTGVAKS